MAKTVEDVKRAVDSLFGDTSCSPEVTRKRLEDVIDYVRECMQAL